VLEVSDERLKGVEEVTAAHEMLHAAYDKLTSKERQRVDKLLENFYENDLHDERIRGTLDIYKDQNHDGLINEMHSIFGTEVATLPTELETYYRQYFDDRAKVVNYASEYAGEFTARQAAIKGYDAQLADIKSEIEGLQNELKNLQGQLEAQLGELNRLRASGNAATYNAKVPVYNSLISEYNSKAAVLKSDIDRYNRLVTERNKIVLEQQQLVESLSGEVTPKSLH
jgi:peptidoglycan hydrolase CwlO-like protein